MVALLLLDGIYTQKCHQQFCGTAAASFQSSGASSSTVASPWMLQLWWMTVPVMAGHLCNMVEACGSPNFCLVVEEKKPSKQYELDYSEYMEK